MFCHSERVLDEYIIFISQKAILLSIVQNTIRSPIFSTLGIDEIAEIFNSGIVKKYIF